LTIYGCAIPLLRCILPLDTVPAKRIADTIRADSASIRKLDRIVAGLIKRTAMYIQATIRTPMLFVLMT
jgi:hypothetical protein